MDRDTEERIAGLDARISELEDVVIDEIDKNKELSRRLEEMRVSYSDRITICGIVASVIIGLSQIAISLWK